MINKLLIVGILIFGCAAAGADEDRDKTYRWEDAKGNVYYSDLPPPAGARKISSARDNSEAPTLVSLAGDGSARNGIPPPRSDRRGRAVGCMQRDIPGM